MATEKQLLEALKRADAAGDAEAARAIARKIKVARTNVEAANLPPDPAPTMQEAEDNLRAAYESGDKAALEAAQRAYHTRQLEVEGAAFNSKSSGDDPAYIKRRDVDLALKQQQEERSIPERMGDAIGADLSGKWRALKQIVESDPVKSAQLQEEERVARAQNKYISDDPVGGLGVLGVDAATAAVPGAGVTSVVKAAPKYTKLLAAILGEGAIGGGYGAITPTAPGESRTSNVATGAVVNAALPVGGAAVRSKPVQKMADKMLENTPFFYAALKNKKEKAARALHDIEAEKIITENAAKKEAYKKEAQNAVQTHKVAMQDAKMAAEEANASATAAERARVAKANAVRETKVADEQDALAKAAGWERAPKDELEMQKFHQDLGAKYGALIDPLRLDSNQMYDAVTKASKVPGLSPEDAKKLEGIATRLADSADVTGTVSGTVYKKIRSEVSKAARGKSGLERDGYDAALTAMDDTLSAAVPEEHKAEIDLLRRQYRIGSNIREVDMKPGGGIDLNAVRKKLSGLPSDDPVRVRLVKALRDMPQVEEVQKLLKIEPNPVGAPEMVHPPVLEPVPKFQKEAGGFAKMSGVQTGLYALGHMAGIGPALNFGLPLAALGVKAAEKPKYRVPLAAALRGSNVYSAPMLAPQEGY